VEPAENKLTEPGAARMVVAQLAAAQLAAAEG